MKLDLPLRGTSRKKKLKERRCALHAADPGAGSGRELNQQQRKEASIDEKGGSSAKSPSKQKPDDSLLKILVKKKRAERCARLYRRGEGYRKSVPTSSAGRLKTAYPMGQ